ncbi:putative c-3 sterol dehydrogenase c-4 decarboxylase [Diaporthe ampelina]|uniref:Putative c-3 sterol dehydrogenase c-4 decarboxylase n=1 Tax=Diaporthe ampelina TaxID=1214573 RepID=A0A0G2HLK6_9PEZI|nr:putative c-3 sterol dehydrogenase c-4 decarboxylase [Diaporthe ampelina]
MAPKLKTPSSTTPAPPPSQRLETVLVAGGCGFLGFYLVGQLLADPDCGPVCIVDRDITRNVHDSPRAEYVACDINDAAEMAGILDRARPEVIFHAASPNATYRSGGDFYRTNVTGTGELIRLAKERPFVKALVYTSSNSAYASHKHTGIRESEPTWTGRPWPWQCVLEHAWTKGAAHRLVLDSNESWRKGGLKTCVVVPANIYGVRDGQSLSLMFDLFQDLRRPVLRVGKGDNLASFVEAGNCAHLHILAAKGLIEGRPGVGGEAFNASDGEDVPLWWHAGITCAAIRGQDVAKVKTIPAWVMCIAVYLVWWVLLIFTLGFMEPPPAFSVERYQWCTQDHTYDIRKARRVLGYAPRSGQEWHEDVVRDAVEWERERRRRAQKEERRAKKRRGKQKAK